MNRKKTIAGIPWQPKDEQNSSLFLYADFWKHSKNQKSYNH